ncbi:restriction endonuclease subunit S [Flavobacterium covae]|uniref:restriction endonuclease subunit S n=1 Tax=Flavobacterium covae TaxID=2906076 RepID=UPI001FB5B937|nr:restriction endonuclease subunit S [Flavobacterium covae]MCJ1805738.1 restriction endonuclease subunit S [Flavobacterium covae]
MSSIKTMSFLDKLLEGLEVEWKPLGEYADYEQPTKYLVKSNNYNDDFSIPVLTAGKTFILGYTDETVGIYKASENPVIIFDDFTTANKWVDFDFKAKSSAMKMITSKDESKALLKYIYYWMNTLPSDLVDGDHKRQWISNYANKLIPIPCPDNPKKSLEIQQKIVGILDTFSELTAGLTAELTAELTARKQQYSYYREQLLRFEEGEVEWKTLGDVILPTSNIRWRDTNKSYRYIDLTSVCREKNTIIETTEINTNNAPSRAQKLILKNDVIFATTRPTQQRLCLITEEYSGEIASTGYCILRADTNHILPKWIYYWITSSEFKKYVEENQSGSAYPAISDTKVKEFKIPVPSIEEQQRIVSILDKFDVLTTSISEGLPKEIELRQKQYEYYRNQLLSFSASR